MKASESKLIEFLRKSPQLVIPIYQRTYSWTEKETRQLWDDVLKAGANEKVAAHFIGSIVYVEKGQSSVTVHEPILVIDGQQRLTTVMLLLAALAKKLESLAEDCREPLEGFSPRKIRNWYLFDPEEEGEKHYKLILSQTDKDSLIAILNDAELPPSESLRVTGNFQVFVDLLELPSTNLLDVCRGIAKLLIVDVSLSRDHDNPQLIFESMNSTGKELSQADLIRNFVLMGLEPKLQTRLYEQYWRPMELDFGQEAYGTHFDAFMRHYLTVKTGEIPRLDGIYDAFKAYSRQSDIEKRGVENLVKDVRQFARYFCCMALGLEQDSELKAAFHDLRELKVDVAFPFLLELYSDYSGAVLDRDDFLKIVRLTESYVFRRAICSIPTNSMNKTFSTFSKAIRKGSYLNSVLAHYMTLPSYRRFPSDTEFHRDIQTRDLYNFPRRSYWLRRLENHGRRERVIVDEYTIEHIMPQNPKLSAEWRAELGEDWERVHATYLHTLGNLTLTAYNLEYSDHPFQKKRDMEGGFRVSPLQVNQGVGTLEHWNEDSIKLRASNLATIALDVWSSPSLAEDVLESFRRPAEPMANYSIESHPHLLTSPNSEVFESFSKQVLALNPCVSREYLKQYVAFKAETNFVDVVPRAKQLCLLLNMEFSEITDPKGIARDVTNLGRWGNGDVEVMLSSMEELPYVLGLVRQAFERQMSGEN